jgi:branched-chain amino acid transport system substrate-binding protein
MNRKGMFISLLVAALGSSAAMAAQDRPILVGQSASLTGGQARYGQDVRDGIEAAFAAVNAKGGVRGRPLQLVSLDDGGTKATVLANTRVLVEQHKVAALIGYTSGAGVEATLPYLDAQGVALVGPATGNMGIRAAEHRALFHVRAGYSDEMKKMANHLATMGLTRFALAYLNDVGPANPQSMVDALARNNLKPVASVALNRNAENFNLEADTLLKGEPETVLFISNAKPVAKLVEAMRARGYTGQFAVASFAGTGLIDDLKTGARGLILSQVLPPPTAKHLKLIASFQDDMREFRPKANLNYTSLEGYVAARVLVEGLRRAAGEGPGKVLAGLEGIERLDLGGYEIRYEPGNHAGSRYVNTGIVDRDGSLRF